MEQARLGVADPERVEVEAEEARAAARAWVAAVAGVWAQVVDRAVWAARVPESEEIAFVLAAARRCLTSAAFPAPR
ncbi:MAG: hypothetical protein AMJ84_05915 [Acidithiobacillales bacterium SM23_46]|nr:MAG: hypothetical protein AMJ84_05915 [Acidithiobacillales bacterium SM23_46]